MARSTLRRSAATRAVASCRLVAGAIAAATLLRSRPFSASRGSVSPPRAFLPAPGASGGTPPRAPALNTPRGRDVQATKSGAFQTVDSVYNPTWLQIEQQDMSSLTWLHPQTLWAGAATFLYAFDMWRILNLIPPTGIEVACAIIVYIGLYTSRMDEVPQLNKHYQVSFYASVGWTLYALVSLVDAMAYSPEKSLPVGVADALHGGACAVYLGSCAYFYAYHWGRQIRHIREGRFRPWFAVGLASLSFAHGLTVGHIFKVLDDPLWYKTTQTIYTQQWQWIADTRLLELYLTAFALFLVILHLRGVLTGTKNAAIVFLGTVILPTVALFGETFYIDAVAWQHYFMVGPKHF